MGRSWLAPTIVTGTAAAVVVLLYLAASPPAGAETSGLLDESGNPMPAPTSLGVVKGSWDGIPVLVITVNQAQLAGVDVVRGPGSATPSAPVPGYEGWRVFALSAVSTHLGCSVAWMPDLGASRDIPDYDMDGVVDGRLMDQCHQGQWDAFNQAAPFAGTPAPAALAVLDVRVVDGILVAASFDGPIGPADA